MMRTEARLFACESCSYIWRDGHLLPVPASKGDVFRSRALSPTDKRVLMRFLKACGDAIEGRGHLKVGSASRLVMTMRAQQKKSPLTGLVLQQWLSTMNAYVALALA